MNTKNFLIVQVHHNRLHVWQFDEEIIIMLIYAKVGNIYSEARILIFRVGLNWGFVEQTYNTRHQKRIFTITERVKKKISLPQSIVRTLKPKLRF